MGRMIRVALSVYLVLGIPGVLLAYSDTDLDGVDDSRDRCPGSSLDDIVDETGCLPKTGFTLIIGGSSSSGDYGTSETISSSTKDLQLTYNKNGWYAGMATSYLESGIEDPATGTESASGMGDTYASLGYTAMGEGTSLGVQGVIKIPTADTDIGTGNGDVGAYVTAVRMTAGSSYFATAGYTLTGDDADMTYNDIASLSIGAGSNVNEAVFVSVSAAYAEAMVEGMEASRTISLFMGYQWNACWFMNAFYTRGLSDSVADNALSMMIGYGF